MINTDNLQLVKGSKMINNEDRFEIWHYGTMILSHTHVNNTTLINYDCSPTSNKMIRRGLELLNKTVDQCVNVHLGGKNNFSGDQC